MDKPSRRDVLIVGAAAPLLLPMLINAQTTSPETPISSEREAELLTRAKKASDGNALERKKYRLKENSEPCFTYLAEPRQVRAR